MKIDLAPHAAGTLLHVRAQPGASHDGVRGVHEGALRLGCTQIAERGKANKALVKVLAEALGVRRSQVELLSGETSSRKQFLIRNLAVDELHTRIEAILARSSSS